MDEPLPLKLSPYGSRTDEELVALSVDGDDLAFQELMSRYLRQVFNFVRQYAGTPEDAEDIAQDTFFKFWKHIKRFKEGKTFRPWLFTIARNTALDHIKKKRPQSFSELDSTSGETDILFEENIADTEPLAPESFSNKELSLELEKILEILNPDHRLVLTLRYDGEMSFEEIARTMKIPMNTAKSWHHRALIRLRPHVEHLKPSHQKSNPARRTK